MSDPVDIDDLHRKYLDDLAEVSAQGGGASLDESWGTATRRLDPESFDDTVRTLLDVLSNEEATTDERLIALQGLATGAFQPRAFAPFHAEYVEALRRVAEGPDKDVRLAALDQLTLLDDPEGQRMLRDSLERPRNLLVPDATAVRLLARNDHGDTAPLLRDLARSGSQRVRVEAVRALASDPESTELLAQISTDRGEKTALRQSAALSLKALSPDRFAAVATSVVLDDDDDDRLRTVALSAMTHTAAVNDAAGGAAALVDDLRDVAAKTSSRALRSEITRFTRGIDTAR